MSLGRQAELRDRLQKAKLDALLCALPMHVLLFSGYWPIMANSVVLFTADGQQQLIVPEDEADNACSYTGVPLTTYSPASLHALIDAKQAVQRPMLDAVRALGLARARIGYESAQFLQPASYLTMNLYHSALAESVRREFPQAELVSADSLLEQMKARKSVGALDKLRRGCQAAKQAYELAAKSIQAGQTECAIASAFEAEHSRAACGPQFQRVESFFFCMSGPNSATADAAYARTRHRTVESGDLVMVHCNCAYDGWWTDITRTFVAGDPQPEYKKMRAAIADAREAALAVIRPGVLGKQVDHAARQVLEKAGYGSNFTHATGHGVGFAAANGNGHPRIHPCSDDRLEESMTFNVEPAIYFKGRYGMRHCDMVAVTADGAEVLTDF